MRRIERCDYILGLLDINDSTRGVKVRTTESSWNMLFISGYKNASFLEVIHNPDYDAPGKMNIKLCGWTKLTTNIQRLAQEEPLYKVKRGE